MNHTQWAHFVHDVLILVASGGKLVKVFITSYYKHKILDELPVLQWNRQGWCIWSFLYFSEKYMKNMKKVPSLQ